MVVLMESVADCIRPQHKTALAKVKCIAVKKSFSAVATFISQIEEMLTN